MKKLLTLWWAFGLLAPFVCEELCAQPVFQRGAGSCSYAGYAPLADKPIEIYYYIPYRGDLTLMPILFAMHGTKRRGADARDGWKELAERYGFIVLSPEYSRKYYDNNAYNYGNVSREKGRFVAEDRERWTYHTIERIFDFFREQTGNVSDKYDIWGHSAGGQFVQRFLLCMPEARVNRAVAANAGTWTFLLPDGLKDESGNRFGWPYSVYGTPFAERENLERYFAREFYVNLGDADIRTDTKDFPKYPAAMAQGPTRYARGNNFYREARRLSRTLRCPFNWHRSVVSGAGHSSRMMIYGTASLRDGKKTYDPDNLSRTAACWLIYGDRLMK